MGARFALDTSCLVPLAHTWDPRHQRTVTAYEGRRGHGEQPVIAAHTLVEACSVLTRMPVPSRMSVNEAVGFLETSFRPHADIVVLPPASYWQLFHEMAGHGIGGGKLYDALIARTVFEAGATVLLTWNARHFLQVAPPGLEIREP